MRPQLPKEHVWKRTRPRSIPFPRDHIPLEELLSGLERDVLIKLDHTSHHPSASRGINFTNVEGVGGYNWVDGEEPTITVPGESFRIFNVERRRLRRLEACRIGGIRLDCGDGCGRIVISLDVCSISIVSLESSKRNPYPTPPAELIHLASSQRTPLDSCPRPHPSSPSSSPSPTAPH